MIKNNIGLLIFTCAFLHQTIAAEVTPLKESDMVGTSEAKNGEIDKVIAIVNREVITEKELKDGVANLKNQLLAEKRALPSQDILNQQVLQKLVDDSVVFQEVMSTRERVSDADLEGIMANIATQNKLTMEQYKDLIQKEGVSFAKFKENLRRDVLIGRYRQRQLESKVKVTDAEVDAFVSARIKPKESGVRPSGSVPDMVNLAQIFIPIPTGANQQEILGLKSKAQKVFEQANKEPEFLTFANQLTKQDPTIKAQDFGPKPSDRLPQIFIDATQSLPAGAMASQVVQSPAGFHILKVLARQAGATETVANASKTESVFVTQNDVNTLMITTKQGVTDDDVLRKLKGIRDQIQAKAIGFEDAAKKYSEDPTVKKNNGHLGWVSPGMLPPEFDTALNPLNPGEISSPFKTNFGWHLVQLVNKKQVEVTVSQQKEYARATLRQEKMAQENENFIRELRDNATIEIRSPYSLPKER
jgi:peptidyl-prolyl cis-trans isomerase SurA